MTFDLGLGVKFMLYVAQCPLHYVKYVATKFEVATSNVLGRDIFTRNVTDERTDDGLTGRICLSSR